MSEDRGENHLITGIVDHLYVCLGGLNFSRTHHIYLYKKEVKLMIL